MKDRNHKCKIGFVEKQYTLFVVNCKKDQAILQLQINAKYQATFFFKIDRL